MSMERIRRDMEKRGIRLADKNKCAVTGCAGGGVAAHVPPSEATGYTRLCATHAEAHARKLAKGVSS